MPTPYIMPSVPNRYPIDRNDKIGLALGALLSGGLAAASSGNTGENPILRAIAGGVTGLGAGGKHLNDSYSAMLEDYLKNEAMDFRNKQFGQQVREYEETDKPYKEAMTRYNESLINKAETPKLPNEAQNWQFGMNIQDPRQRSEFLNRTMPLKTNKPLTGKVKSYDDYLSDISKVEKQLADLQIKNTDGNYEKAINSLTHRRNMLMRKLDMGGVASKPTTVESGATAPEHDTITEEDLDYTANKYGIAREDVLRRLGTK